MTSPASGSAVSLSSWTAPAIPSIVSMTLAPLLRTAFTASDSSARKRILARGSLYSKRTSAMSPTVTRPIRPVVALASLVSTTRLTCSTVSNSPSARTT